MLKKIVVRLDMVLLLLLQCSPCMLSQITTTTTAGIEWKGSRYETDDEILRLPNHTSCSNIKGINKNVFSTLRRCHCKRGRIFHAFSKVFYGCYLPTEVCGNADCQNLGRGKHIQYRKNYSLIKLSTKKTQIKALLPKPCPSKNQQLRGTFSKWENNDWKEFDKDTHITFKLFDGQFVNLEVDSSVKSSSGLVKINVWCTNDTSRKSTDFIITLSQPFEYIANLSAFNLTTRESSVTNKIETTTLITATTTTTPKGFSSSTITSTTTSSLTSSTRHITTKQNINKSHSGTAGGGDVITKKIKLLYIILLAAGGFVLIFIIISIICCACRCRKRKKEVLGESSQSSSQDDFSASEYADPRLFLDTNTLRHSEGNEAPVYSNAVTNERYASIDIRDKPFDEYQQLTKKNPVATTEPIYFDTEIEYYPPGAVMDFKNESENIYSVATEEPFYHETMNENDVTVIENAKIDEPAVKDTKIEEKSLPVYTALKRTNGNGKPKFYVDIERNGTVKNK